MFRFCSWISKSLLNQIFENYFANIDKNRITREWIFLQNFHNIKNKLLSDMNAWRKDLNDCIMNYGTFIYIAYFAKCSYILWGVNKL